MRFERRTHAQPSLDIPDFAHAVFGQIPRLDERAEEVLDTCQDEKRLLYKQGSGLD